MIDFSMIRRYTPEQKKLHDYKVHQILAASCIDHIKKDGSCSNKCIYDALSHLSQVPVLEINLNAYDRLIYQCNLPFDKDSYLLCKNKLAELEELISSMTGGV